MAEWQQNFDQKQIQSPTRNTSVLDEYDEGLLDEPAEPTNSTDLQQVGYGGGMEDDFGGFGGEFEADFDDFDEAPFTGAAPSTVYIDEEGQSKLSIDTVLARTSFLFTATKDYESCAETIRQCLARIFDGRDDFSAASDVPDQNCGLLTPRELESCLESSVSTLKLPTVPEPEPRLLQNVLVVALSTTIPDDVRMRLLTPLSELSIEETRLLAQVSPTAALFDISKVRRIANDYEQTTPAELSRALSSLNALIADKEQEVVRRRDAVVAYNQVIQTLVAQASKLH